MAAAAPLNFPIQSVHFGGRYIGADYSFPRHAHSWHQLYAVLQGRIRVWVEGRVVMLRGGEALWLAPSHLREPRSACEQGRYLTVMFRSPWPQLGVEPGRKVRLGREGLARATECADIAARWSTSTAGTVAFHALCLHLLGPEAFNDLDPGKAAAPGEDDHGRWMVTRLEELMLANVGTQLGLEDMAALVHVSRATLGRLFRIHRRVSPAARFREIRLERAMQMLRTTRLTITEIALETGFSSSQHFATAFRRHFGPVPTAVPREQIMYSA
ncbi:AraC family transcriptional regulator [Verrucomicrobia bacterium LW23]|nr:AraC family transcriptional regulator [Verrucomicrobia bacterium LW23]